MEMLSVFLPTSSASETLKPGMKSWGTESEARTKMEKTLLFGEAMSLLLLVAIAKDTIAYGKYFLMASLPRPC